MGNFYNLTVPVMNFDFAHHMDREKTVELMKKMGVSRVMIGVESNSTSGEAKKKVIADIRDNTEYLHSRGFEVGAWFWAFYNTQENNFVRMVSPEGKVSTSTICPTDENYCEEMCEFIKAVAETGVDMIQFDDDLRYGFQDIGFGCLCRNHLRKIGEYLGEEVDFDTVAHGIMNGGKNKYRDAFLAVNGAVFEEFAGKCREVLDTVNPSVRMGFCACITSWDIDGTTPDRLARILAGKTRPFYRLIGAPYWASLCAWGHTRISYVIEQERLEANRREENDIEIFSEGDTYPRPRYRVPSAYLEAFDTVLRADGCTDGILKYTFDYTANWDYEKGYNEQHLRNLPLYCTIEKIFSEKETVGVRVFDSMRKFSDLTMPTDVNNPVNVQNLAFNVSARFLAANSIPSVYNGNEYSGVAFGEDARILTNELLENGALIDYAAAMILKEKGIDTGIISENGTAEMSGTEYFSSGEMTNTLTSTRIHKVTLADNAEICSYIEKNGIKLPVFYKYVNADGQKFAVFTFDGYNAEEHAFRNYERQKQVTEALQWLCGKKLPAVCTGHPDLYILTKRKENLFSVGLWNLFPDKIYNAKVDLPEKIKSIRIFKSGQDCINNIASLDFKYSVAEADGNILNVSEIAPYDLVMAEIELTD